MKNKNLIIIKNSFIVLAALFILSSIALLVWSPAGSSSYSSLPISFILTSLGLSAVVHYLRQKMKEERC